MNHKNATTSYEVEWRKKNEEEIFDDDGGILSSDLRFVCIYCGSGSPSIRALGKYLPNRLRVHPNPKFFVGICIGIGEVQRETRCLESKPKEHRDEIETDIDTGRGGRNCIRNHGNTNTNAHCSTVNGARIDKTRTAT